MPAPALEWAGQGAQHLVTLTSVEDDALGEELQVIWELEPGTSVIEKAALPGLTGFDPPERLDAFLDAVRWGAASTADVRSIQSPFRSGIDIEDYQLDPVVRAIQMPRVNLLIADDVGLGKTIEAGMVALELIIRHRARRILVVCPAALQIQWQEQMRDKFGLDFRIVDSDLMRELRRKRGIHVNPWTHFPRLITSIDYLKRERPLRLFRETLPAPGEPIYPRRYDILIVDEAHNCAPSGRGKYAQDSLRTEAIRTLTPHFEHKLFLTATPHNGYSESFTALLELLDDQRFARGTPPDDRQLRTIMVRRLKSELEKNWDGSPRFAQRELEAIEVDYSDEERRAHQALREYTALRQESTADASGRLATEFVLRTLKKRLFSSPEAFRVTLARHLRSLKEVEDKQAKARTSVGILQREIDRVEEEYLDDDDTEDAISDVVDTATNLFDRLSPEERALLKELEAWADDAVKRPDCKARCLVDWLHEAIKPGGKWSDRRVIIFTEYRATQNWIAQILASERFTGGNRMMTIHGGLQTDEREAIKNAFQADPEDSPVRILLATDAASEGIDLQNHCSRLIHYEIPWNPNRMEQRNGRIDRHGQRADEVLIYHFVGQGYQQRREQKVEKPVGDLEGDLEFLMRAALKVKAIREDLGKVGPVIAAQVEEAMLGRRRTIDTAQAEKEAGAVSKLLKFEHDLAQQIKQLVEQLHVTQEELHLSPANIQKVVEIGLDLAGQRPLVPTAMDGIWPDEKRHACPVFHLPALTGSWAACTEGLQHPHTQAIRPLVFDHRLAHGRDDVVLVHLNHRLVQMCLRLLRAEVWASADTKSLHRVAARVVPDDALQVPAIVAHARLVVIGGDSHRLHEEIITAGGTIREGRFSRMKVGEVRDALAAATLEEPSEAVREKLLKLWPSMEQPLQQSLEARMSDRTGGLARQLAQRCEKEVADITSILTELRDRIQAELDDPEYIQLQFDELTTPEREQHELNVDFLRRRVREIPQEIEDETAAIRARFADPQPRMFPVAVTCLVPERFAAD